MRNVWTILAIAAILAPGAAFAGKLELGAPQVQGDQVVIPVNLTGDVGAGVASMNFDLKYDPAVLVPDRAVAGQAATQAAKSVSANSPADGSYRLVVMGLNQNVMQSGEVAQIVMRKVGEPSGGRSNMRIVDTTFAAADASEIPSRGDSQSLALDGSAQSNDNNADQDQDEQMDDDSAVDDSADDSSDPQMAQNNDQDDNQPRTNASPQDLASNNPQPGAAPTAGPAGGQRTAAGGTGSSGGSAASDRDSGGNTAGNRTATAQRMNNAVSTASGLRNSIPTPQASSSSSQPAQNGSSTTQKTSTQVAQVNEMQQQQPSAPQGEGNFQEIQLAQSEPGSDPAASTDSSSASASAAGSESSGDAASSSAAAPAESAAPAAEPQSNMTILIVAGVVVLLGIGGMLFVRNRFLA